MPKLLVHVGLNSRIAQLVLDDAVAYVTFVEEAIGDDPRKTAPWVFHTSDRSGRQD
jgi:hypothetical protein